jgi:hypothetical protein
MNRTLAGMQNFLQSDPLPLGSDFLADVFDAAVAHHKAAVIDRVPAPKAVLAALTTLYSQGHTIQATSTFRTDTTMNIAGSKGVIVIKSWRGGGANILARDNSR